MSKHKIQKKNIVQNTNRKDHKSQNKKTQRKHPPKKNHKNDTPMPEL